MDETKEEIQKMLEEARQNSREAHDLWVMVLNRKPYIKADWHIALACETMFKRYETEIHTLEKKLVHSSSGIEKYVSFQCANEMIQYILENVHWEDYGTDEDEILKRFIEYLEKETEA